MAVGRLGDDVAGDLFDRLMAEDWSGALFYDNPFGADPLTVEVVGEEYERQPASKERHAFNLIRVSNTLTFLNLPPGTHIEAVGVMDNDTGGSMRAACLLDDPVDLPDGGNYVIAANELQVGLDVTLGP